MSRVAEPLETHVSLVDRAEQNAGQIRLLNHQTIGMLQDEDVVWRFALVTNGVETQLAFGDSDIYTHSDILPTAWRGISVRNGVEPVIEFGRLHYKRGIFYYAKSDFSEGEETFKFLDTHFPGTKLLFLS